MVNKIPFLRLVSEIAHFLPLRPELRESAKLKLELHQTVASYKADVRGFVLQL